MNALLPTGNGRAVLQEIAARLEELARTGQGAIIDLRALPLNRADYDQIRDELGMGAVAALVEAEGHSSIHESRYPGAWWVMHRDSAGEVVADLIEICAVPAILPAPAEDIALGAAALAEALQS